MLNRLEVALLSSQLFSETVNPLLIRIDDDGSDCDRLGKEVSRYVHHATGAAGGETFPISSSTGNSPAGSGDPMEAVGSMGRHSTEGPDVVLDGVRGGERGYGNGSGAPVWRFRG